MATITIPKAEAKTSNGGDGKKHYVMLTPANWARIEREMKESGRTLNFVGNYLLDAALGQVARRS